MKNKQLRLALILALGCTAAQARYQDKHDNNQNDNKISRSDHFFRGLFQGPVAVTQDAGEGVVGVVTLDRHGDASGLAKTVPDAVTWGHYRKNHSDDDRMNDKNTRSNRTSSPDESSFDRWRRRHDERRDERHKREEARHERHERSNNNQ